MNSDRIILDYATAADSAKPFLKALYVGWAFVHSMLGLLVLIRLVRECALACHWDVALTFWLRPTHFMKVWQVTPWAFEILLIIEFVSAISGLILFICPRPWLIASWSFTIPLSTIAMTLGYSDLDLIDLENGEPDYILLAGASMILALGVLCSLACKRLSRERLLVMLAVVVGPIWEGNLLFALVKSAL